MVTPDQISIDHIRRARDRIRPWALHTPLVRLNLDDAPAQIYLKLENLQPIGSFKQRGATYAMSLIDRDEAALGVYTASMGNMAQGVAWYARKMGIPCSIVVPDNAPKTKLDAIAELGGNIIQVTFERWWQVMVTREIEGLTGRFIHPVCDPAVIAGHGTVGLEILEDLPDVDAVLVPYGGGGLSSGIASAVRAIKPDTKVFGCEVETAAPLAESLRQKKPSQVRFERSFVEGIGGKSVLEEMWPLVSTLLDGAIVSTLAQIADAIRILVSRNRVVAEGAGAASVAAALSGKAGTGKVVCVISGGNIDAGTLATILQGKLP